MLKIVKNESTVTKLKDVDVGTVYYLSLYSDNLYIKSAIPNKSYCLTENKLYLTYPDNIVVVLKATLAIEK